MLTSGRWLYLSPSGVSGEQRPALFRTCWEHVRPDTGLGWGLATQTLVSMKIERGKIHLRAPTTAIALAAVRDSNPSAAVLACPNAKPPPNPAFARQVKPRRVRVVPECPGALAVAAVPARLRSTAPPCYSGCPLFRAAVPPVLRPCYLPCSTLLSPQKAHPPCYRADNRGAAPPPRWLDSRAMRLDCAAPAPCIPSRARVAHSGE